MLLKNFLKGTMKLLHSVFPPKPKSLTKNNIWRRNELIRVKHIWRERKLSDDSLFLRESFYELTDCRGNNTVNNLIFKKNQYWFKCFKMLSSLYNYILTGKEVVQITIK